MNEKMEINDSLGLSEELFEDPNVGSVVFNTQDGKWSISVFPPIDSIKNSSIYFQIYDIKKDKIARISMTFPEYIHCLDCSKKEWILNHEEKEYLCRILSNDIWVCIQNCFAHERSYYDDIEYSLDLAIPDYMQLPEE